VTVIAARLLFVPTPSPATEHYPLIVPGIALDKVATVHPAPVYPLDAIALGVDGIVQVEVTVENGRIIEAKALLGNPMLGYSAKTWIVWNWKFRPEISGVITIPVNYQRQALYVSER
jgi:hypothetical protein